MLTPHTRRIPHSLYESPTSTICLITVDPQRQFKNAIAHPAFPAALRSRITRVIGISKLRAKYKSFESRRQLLNEHDVFLSDDRVVNLLPQTLGKVFYKTGAKRPVPVCISGFRKKGKAAKEGEKSMAPPLAMASEIGRALSAALVHLSPSVTTAVRVAKAGWDEQKVVENVEAVVNGIVEKFVPKKWKNIRSLHIKGPNTTGLPLWLAQELWLDKQDVLGDRPAEELKKAIEGSTPTEVKRKRKRAEEAEESGEEQSKVERKKKRRYETNDAGSQGNAKVLERRLRKEKLKKQKMAVLADFDDDTGATRKIKQESKPAPRN
jgi:ribosome biogenesis protein UTP30